MVGAPKEIKATNRTGGLYQCNYPTRRCEPVPLQGESLTCWGTTQAPTAASALPADPLVSESLPDSLKASACHIPALSWLHHDLKVSLACQVSVSLSQRWL